MLLFLRIVGLSEKITVEHGRYVTQKRPDSLTFRARYVKWAKVVNGSECAESNIAHSAPGFGKLGIHRLSSNLECDRLPIEVHRNGEAHRLLLKTAAL